MEDNNKNSQQGNQKDEKKTNPTPPKANNQMNIGGKKFNVYWIYIVIILGILGLNFFYGSKTPIETTWNEVQFKMLREGDIDKLVVVRNLGKVEVYLNTDRKSVV